MALFHKSDDDTSAPATADPYADTLASFGGSLADQAATLLSHLGPALTSDIGDQSRMQAHLTGTLLPDPRGNWPDSYTTLRLRIAQAFETLVQARLLVRFESGAGGGFMTFYYLSEEGQALLNTSDVTAVIARRLPV